AHPPIGDFAWTSVLLRDSAWNAASSTGAIAFMDYSEVKRYSQLYALQKITDSILDSNLQGRHEMNVFLMRMDAPGKLSDAEFEGGKRIILSEKLRVLEFRELDNALNDRYTKLLSQGN
ncbi:MAG: hypothetical protein ABR991_09785, partial [Terracidiphilus sp.]